MRNPFKLLTNSRSSSITPRAAWDYLFVLLQPIFWKYGFSNFKLENFFKNYLGIDYAITFIQGRVGLYAVLKSLNLQKSDQVLVQSYTHVAVSNAITWNKAIPVYVDIYSDTFNMDASDLVKKITKRSRVLIIQHTYGLAADLDKLLKIAKKNKLFVIEDCAHSIGSSYKSKKVGSFGDAAFFSLGRNKLIDASSGGVVVTPHKWLYDKLKDYRDSLPYPDIWWIFRFLFFPLGMKLTNQVYYFFNLGKNLYTYLRGVGFFPKAVVEQEKVAVKPKDFAQKLPNSLAYVALKQLLKLDSLVGHRRKLAGYYNKALKGLPLKLPEESNGYYHAYLVYNVLTDKNLDIIEKAQSKNILIGNWFHKAAIEMAEADPSKFYYKANLCPNAEKLAQSSLDLPTVATFSIEDAKILVNFLKNYFKLNGKNYHNRQINNP